MIISKGSLNVVICKARLVLRLKHANVDHGSRRDQDDHHVPDRCCASPAHHFGEPPETLSNILLETVCMCVYNSWSLHAITSLCPVVSALPGSGLCPDDDAQLLPRELWSGSHGTPRRVHTNPPQPNIVLKWHMLAHSKVHIMVDAVRSVYNVQCSSTVQAKDPGTDDLIPMGPCRHVSMQPPWSRSGPACATMHARQRSS